MKRSLLLILISTCLPLGFTSAQTGSAPRAATPAPPAQRNSAYDDAVAKARALAAQKDFKAAATTSEQAIQMDDKRWEGYIVAAESYSGQQLYDDAIGMLQMALVRAPNEKKPAIREAITETRKLLSGQSPMAAAVPTPSGVSAAPPASSPAAAPTQAEIILWKSIEKSKDTSDYRAYLDAYPNGVYAPLASRRVQDLTETTIDAGKQKARIKELLQWVQQNGFHGATPRGANLDITTVNGCTITVVSTWSGVNKKGFVTQTSSQIAGIDLGTAIGSDMQILPEDNLWSVNVPGGNAGGFNSNQIYFGDRAVAAEALDKLVEAADLCHESSAGQAVRVPTAPSPVGVPRPSVRIGSQ